MNDKFRIHFESGKLHFEIIYKKRKRRYFEYYENGEIKGYLIFHNNGDIEGEGEDVYYTE